MRLSPEIGIKSVAAIYTRPAQAGKSAGSQLENLGAPKQLSYRPPAQKRSAAPKCLALRVTKNMRERRSGKLT